MMTAFQLGIQMGCEEHGVSPRCLPYYSGFAKKLAATPAAAGRILIKHAHAAMRAAGAEFTAPALHLDFMCKSADWNAHYDDVVADITRAISAISEFEKQAFADAITAAGLGTRGVLYAAVGAGAGIGSLAWLLARHANQDEAEIDAMQRQKDYYVTLNKELQDSMKRKYNYENAGKPETRKPTYVGS